MNAFGNFEGKPKDSAEHLWKKFGRKTIKNMQSGAHLLAVLWESAWTGRRRRDSKVKSTRSIDARRERWKSARDFDFIPSVRISRIGALLKKPV